MDVGSDPRRSDDRDGDAESNQIRTAIGNRNIIITAVGDGSYRTPASTDRDAGTAS